MTWIVNNPDWPSGEGEHMIWVDNDDDDATDTFNVNGLYIEGADTGRPMLKALYEEDPSLAGGREATVAELAFWRALSALSPTEEPSDG